MELLVLGGTMFLGRHLVEQALAAGHRVTLLNRGRTNPGLFPDAERITADRTAYLSALDGRGWDAVVDTCGYVPRVVRASAEALAERTAHYTFVSSISVYPSFPAPGLDETAPVGTLEDPTIEQITGETYGPLKALCEQAAEEVMPGRVLTVRPGLIVGPHDPTDRYTYWPARIARGGEVLAPGDPASFVQYIDGRDLAAWMLGAVEQRVTGTFNATGRPEAFGALLDTCIEVAGSDARVTWVEEAFLLERDVAPWTEVPLWIPASDPEGAHMHEVSIDRALAAGLRLRSSAETAADTLAWDRSRTERRQGPQLTVERERALLDEWHARGD